MKLRLYNRITAFLLSMLLLASVLPSDVRAEDAPPSDAVLAIRNTEPVWTWPYVSCFSGTEAMSFHEALMTLNGNLIVFMERFRDEQKCDSIEFYYNDNAKILSMKKLEKLAAAYAVRIGMTPQELEQATLTGEALELLHSVYREMFSVYIRRTETDVVSDSGSVYTHVALTAYIRIMDEIPPSWGMSGELQQLYHRYCDEFEDVLRTICYGTAGSAAGSIRQRVVSAALSRVGVTPYFWGEKYDELGIDPRWGFPRLNEEGKVDAYGLDCSGLVSWAFINAAGKVEALQYIGSGTSGQFSNSEVIPRDAVQIGDLAYRREDYNGGHIGIVVGFDYDGEPLVCNCAKNSGTVVCRASDISANCFLCPTKYYEQYTVRPEPIDHKPPVRPRAAGRHHPAFPGPLRDEER